MLRAVLWSALATGTLLIGMWLAYRNLINKRWTGLIMAFGAGAIISAVAYQLIPLSVMRTSSILLLTGIAAGSVVYYFADRWVDNMGGKDRMDFDGAQAEGSGTAILLGSLLDGVPESLVLGLSLVHSPHVSAAYIFAVAIGNIPQGLGGTAGMLTAGWTKRNITLLWLGVSALSIMAAAAGYAIAGAFSDAEGYFADAFAAGALLVMMTDSMIPESFQHGKREAGLFLVLGFGVAMALTLIQMR